MIFEIATEHKNETSLIKLLRKTLDSPGDVDLYRLGANVCF